MNISPIPGEWHTGKAWPLTERELGDKMRPEQRFPVPETFSALRTALDLTCHVVILSSQFGFTSLLESILKFQ